MLYGATLTNLAALSSWSPRALGIVARIRRSKFTGALTLGIPRVFGCRGGTWAFTLCHPVADRLTSRSALIEFFSGSHVWVGEVDGVTIVSASITVLLIGSRFQQSL